MRIIKIIGYIVGIHLGIGLIFGLLFGHRQPTLTPFPAANENNTGTAVIVCPGGSYSWLDMKTEGIGVAQWLQKNGINAFVLQYSVANISAYVLGYRVLGIGNKYPKMLEDVQSYFGNNPINLTREEEIELKTLAMAEGESEGVIGKALIMCTVFNRMKEGSSVHDIVFGGAYNVTAAGGRYYTVVPDEECEIALLMVAAGWDGSQGAKYFCTGGYSTYGEPLFRYKNHYFSA